MGSIVAGCIAAGIYMTNAAEACHYITDHSKAEVVVVEGNHQLKKYTNTGAKLSFIKALVVYREAIDRAVADNCGVPVYSWDDFLRLGINVTYQAIDRRGNSIRPGNCASLIYTSGTTGPPKAVMISHDNITWTAQNIINHYMYLNHEDRVVSYLPLSHIAAQLIDMYCILSLGGCTYFAQPDALKGSSLIVTMKEVKPTFFFGVPSVYTKIEEKLRNNERKNNGTINAIIFKYAKLIGSEHCRQMQYVRHDTSGRYRHVHTHQSLPCFYNCAKQLVFSKIKEELGLDHCKGCFTAAAPISIETIQFFASLDIPIYEVYGQSECTGPYTVSYEGIWKIGSCGRPMKGTDCKLQPITGELCYRGRHIFMGYMHMPDKTAETIDEDGFLHSGDIAEFDGDNDPCIPAPSGFMKITGRIKELIITAGGENIPPVLIENEVKGACVAVSNCMLIGDKRKYLTMLISLKVKTDSDGLPTDILAPDSLFIGKKIDSAATTYTEAKTDPLWKKCIDEAVKVANSKTTSNAQIIQKWTWLTTDFSEKGGELTPTLKLKRNIVHDLSLIHI